MSEIFRVDGEGADPAEMLSPLRQKSHSSPTMTSGMTVQNLLQIIQQNVQQVLSSHKLLTTLL